MNNSSETIATRSFEAKLSLSRTCSMMTTKI
jgi:hypothetical protein